MIYLLTAICILTLAGQLWAFQRYRRKLGLLVKHVTQYRKHLADNARAVSKMAAEAATLQAQIVSSQRVLQEIKDDAQKTVVDFGQMGLSHLLGLDRQCADLTHKTEEAISIIISQLAEKLVEADRARVDIASHAAQVQSIASQADSSLKAVELTNQAARDMERVTSQTILNLEQIASSQVAAHTRQYDELTRTTADRVSQLTDKLNHHIEHALDDDFRATVDARVKAEVSKWVFGGEAGGRIAVYQYCVRCSTRSPVWSMIPDEGPVCEACILKDEA